jgi:hypothetical protein
MRKGGHHIDRLHLWRGRRRRKKKRNRLCKALPPKDHKTQTRYVLPKRSSPKAQHFCRLALDSNKVAMGKHSQEFGGGGGEGRAGDGQREGET